MPYIPFLKIKQGEFAALDKLTADIFDRIKPYHLFVDDTNSNRIGSYFETFAKPLSKIYKGGKHSCFVDLNQFTSVSKTLVCEYMQAELINFTYVIRNCNIELEVASVLRDSGMLKSGIAILLDASDQYNFDVLNSRLRDIKTFFNIDETSIDLILQFGFLQSNQIGYQVAAFEKFQQNVIGFDYFRNVIAVSGAFPKDVTSLATGSITDLPRHELSLFKELSNICFRQLTFGDHGNLHCIYDPEAGGFEGSATLKYTTRDSYRVFRGSKPSEHARGYAQYIDKCKLLASTNDFDGPEFSYGDGQIHLYANDVLEKPGNATTWITNTLNHHITRAAREFS